MPSDEYPYVQLYTPKTRDAIAIEPMTCPPNVFNSGEELWQLRSDEWRSASYTIQAHEL